MQIKLAVAGSGHADKDDVLTAVMRELDLESPPRPDDAAAALAIELPTTLTTPKVLEPTDLAFSNAAKVSAVSPDWLITITVELAVTAVFLYLNSDAYSTFTGISIKSSKI